MQHALPRRPARAPCAARHPLPRRAAASASASASSAPPSVVPSPPSRPRPTPEQAASAVALLRAAADGASPPPADVCAAMRTLEQARPAAPPAQLATALSAPNRWRLLFTSSGADMRSKAGGGRYWPTFLKACISWDVKTLTLRNAVALGHLAGLQFEDGPMRQKGWRLQFDFRRVTVKLLGLKLRFSLKPAGWELPATGTKEGDFGLPFFLFSYADDKVAVARGKTGGVAVWARATPAWLLESGVAGLD